MDTPSSPSSDTRMSGQEIRASASLASIFALRMLGLFLIMPVFAIYAKDLQGGDNATLVGLALGIYGLTQCLGQIPFGMASDRLGRKPVIVVGLVLFMVGSFVAAATDDIIWVIIGRALQGAGAISAAVTAFIADVTREEHRTKAMAMVGMSIGVTFAVSLVMSPILSQWVGVSGIFALTGLLAIGAIFVVIFVVPTAPMVKRRTVPVWQVLRDTELMRMNVGVFVLHMTQVVMFVILPVELVRRSGLAVNMHWKVYLPIVLLSFVFMMPPIFYAEKRARMKQVLLASVALLACVQAGFWWLMGSSGMHWELLVALLFLFFLAFNILEACQPSLVSRMAPAEAKGTALGVYNTTQALGLFCGGLLGGWLTKYVGQVGVFTVTTIAVLVWLVVASRMKNVPKRSKAAAV